MMKQLSVICTVLSIFTLSACSSMNSSFDCPNKAGVNCRSLDQINSMVDTGQIRGQSDVTSSAVSEKSAYFGAFPSTTSYKPGQPLRYGETVQRIWVAPYEDTEGNYHQDNFMYVIVKGGHWIGDPEKSIKAV